MRKDQQVCGIRLLANEWLTIKYIARLRGTNQHRLAREILQQFLKDNPVDALPDEG